MVDVAIIGGGVIGAFCARELRKYAISVAVLEGAEDVAAGASKANSGIVHAGYDAENGTLKAKFNVAGNKLMPKVCEELGVGYRNNGSLVLAERDRVGVLSQLKERGEKNGVKGLEVIGRARALALEPHLGDGVAAALYAPTGGIVCPFQLTIAAMGNAMDNGASLYCGFEVAAAEKTDGGWSLVSSYQKRVEARCVVNCAGLNAAKVAAMFGDDSFRIGARKGEYILLDKIAPPFVRHTVFAVPTAAGKGVLVTPTTDGNVLIGPTSAEGEFDTSVRRNGFDEITKKASSMLKNIPFGETISSFAGVRAYSDRHDFIIEESDETENLIHVAGIESPGLTSAPAIGEYVAALCAEKFHARRNENFDPMRQRNRFKDLSAEEKNEIIARRPDYGKVVCRCENVTLGEILDALRQNPPARTLDGVKFRTRAGMGRCQGGFCQPSVFNTLMQEYGYRAQEITKKGKNSFVITGGEL